MPRDSRLNAAYLERKLRAIGLVGSAPLEDLKDVAGLITVESDRAEWAFPGGEWLRMCHANAGAVAAELSFVGLINPGGSNMLFIVEVLKARGQACNVYQANSTAVAAAFPRLAGAVAQTISAFARDFRLGTQVSSAALEVGSNVVSPWTGPIDVMEAPERIVMSSSPIILPPDSALVVAGGIVNTAMAAGFWWRERNLEGNVEIK